MYCSICLDPYKKDAKEDISSTTCGHVFHQTCILPWIEKSKNCPDCRSVLKNTDVIKLYLFVEVEETAANGDNDAVKTCTKTVSNPAGTSRRSVSTKDMKTESNAVKELAAMKAELAAVKFERKDWMSKFKKLEKKHDIFKARSNVKNEASLEKLRELRTEKRQFQVKIRRLEKEVEKITAKETSLKEDIETQKSEHEEIVVKLKTDIEALEEQVRNLKDENHLTNVQARTLESGILKKRTKLQPRLRTSKRIKSIALPEID